jgi:hypothetical protein
MSASGKLVQAAIISHDSHSPLAMKFKAAVLAKQSGKRS